MSAQRRDLADAARVKSVDDLHSYLEASLQHLLAFEEWKGLPQDDRRKGTAWGEVESTASEHRAALEQLTGSDE